MVEDIQVIHNLFDHVCQSVFDEGGDGDAWIISEQCRELADLFEAYQSEWIRMEQVTDGCIYFSGDDQATICFLNDRSQIPEWGSIIVELEIT